MGISRDPIAQLWPAAALPLIPRRQSSCHLLPIVYVLGALELPQVSGMSTVGPQLGLRAREGADRGSASESCGLAH